ncbi:hypothetical protein [Agrobacterium radiobacter]|uniref:hypothetical protein n=1 Tax=Agrobacterium radiobacter TaxID=362 RepID=UPI0034667A9C
MAEPLVTNGRLQHLPQGANLIMESAARWLFAGLGSRHPVDAVVLDRPGVDLGKAHLAEEGDQVEPQADTVALDPFLATLTFCNDGVFLLELLGGFREGGFGLKDAHS